MTKQPPNPTKRCSKCKTNKPLEDFHKNSAYVDGLQPYCKKCRNAHLEKRYRITTNDFHEMLAEQGDACAICGTTEPGGCWNTWNVDHDHATDEVRGLLCLKCNVGLGCFDDDPDRLQKAIDYLIWHKELGEAA